MEVEVVKLMEVEVVKLTHLTCPIFFGVSSIPRGGGGHSHLLPYGGVPLYRVDFERPVSLK